MCYWAVTPIKFKVKLISERGGQNTKVVVVDGKLWAHCLPSEIVKTKTSRIVRGFRWWDLFLHGCKDLNIKQWMHIKLYGIHLNIRLLLYNLHIYTPPPNIVILSSCWFCFNTLRRYVKAAWLISQRCVESYLSVLHTIWRHN